MRNILIKVLLFFSLISFFSTTFTEEKKTYNINFKNVPIIEFINFVSKVCSANFLYDEADLNFNVTVVSDEEIPPSNAMATLLQILRIHGLTLLEDDSNLVIHKNPDVKQLAKIVTEKTSLENAPPIVTKVFRVKNTKVDSLANIIRPMISTEALIEISYDTRQLIITDVTSNIKKISDLIDIIDSPQNPLEIEIYKAKINQPSTLIDMTNQIITPLTEGTPFILVPQDTNGTIFIISTPKLIEKAISILSSLDVSPKSDIKKSLKPANIFVYKLLHQSGAVIERFINEMVQSLKKSGYSETGLLEILNSAKWIKETNSFLFTGSSEAIAKMQEILTKVDVPFQGLEGQRTNFFIYKPTNRPVSEIASAVLELSDNLASSKVADPNLIDSLKSVKVVEATNSLLFSGDSSSFSTIKELLTSIDLTGGPSLGKITFFIYKIQNSSSDQLIAALNNTAENLKKADVPEKALIKAIESVKHIEDSNSLLFTGDSTSLKQIQELLPSFDTDLKSKRSSQFLIYKPKSRSIEDISESLKEIASNLQASNLVSPSFMKMIENMKLVSSTQSLLFAGDDASIKRLQELLVNIDTPYTGEKFHEETYFLYKLLHTTGNIIEEDLDNFAEKLKSQKIKNPELIKTIQNAKWIKETNSLMLTGNPKVIEEAKQLIEKYDIPHRQETALHSNFFIYNPKFASTSYIENSLKDTVSNLQKAKLADPDLINAVENLKIIESTQSLAFTGAEKTIEKIKSLIATIDIPSAAATPLKPGSSYILYKVLKASPHKLISSLKAMGTDLKKSGTSDKDLIEALDSMKYQTDTHSILITGAPAALEKVRSILEKFDTADLTDLEPQKEGPSGYFVYKPKYLTGPSLENVLHNFLDHLRQTGFENPGLFQVIQNMNWDESTNTLIFSGAEKSISELKALLETFDIPAKEPTAGTNIIQPAEETSFLVYKLQYHKGDEIQGALKQISKEFETSKSSVKKNLLSAINSIQWIQVTNSLLASGDRDVMAKIKDLIASMDVPLKQVFIEMLVIETSFTNLLNFGLDWASKFKYRQKFVAGASNSPTTTTTQDQFMTNFGSISESSTPKGTTLPFGQGFDLGVIGDILLHKGTSFLSLGSFVKAIQTDNESTVVMTPKILTQDGKQSTIFIGQNTPYIGSQNTVNGVTSSVTQNLEYRDIGMNLIITPVLGSTDTVTLDINMERTINLSPTQTSQTLTGVQGITTSKTSMKTTVHMPDKAFLVLSGMVTESKTKAKSGIPCLGGLPLIGAAFSESDTLDDRKNVVIFIRPHIINSYMDMGKVSENQEDYFREHTGSPNMEEDYQDAVESIKDSDDE